MSPTLKLEDLIASVHEEAAGDDPLTQLTKASEYAGGLPSDRIPFSRRSKNLLRAILDEAPSLGHLWSTIGIYRHPEPGRPLM
jgi:hypothetical protein